MLFWIFDWRQQIRIREIVQFIQLNMVFKTSRSSMFYRIGVLKSYAVLTWKHLTPVSLIKTDFSTGTSIRVFPETFGKFLRITFLQNTSGQPLLDFFIHLTTELFFAIHWTNRSQVFYNFEQVLSRLSNVMNIMSFVDRENTVTIW